MMRRRGHLRRRDAAGAIERRKNLAEANHVAADARVALDNKNLQSLVGKIERRLQAGDAAANDERIRRIIRVNLRIHPKPPCIIGARRGKRAEA